MNYAMSDIYGGVGFGTTEITIPDSSDQKALVDDEKSAEYVAQTTANKKPLFLAVIGIIVLAFIMGVIK